MEVDLALVLLVPDQDLLAGNVRDPVDVPGRGLRGIALLAVARAAKDVDRAAAVADDEQVRLSVELDALALALDPISVVLITYRSFPSTQNRRSRRRQTGGRTRSRTPAGRTRRDTMWAVAMGSSAEGTEPGSCDYKKSPPPLSRRLQTLPGASGTPGSPTALAGS